MDRIDVNTNYRCLVCGNELDVEDSYMASDLGLLPKDSNDEDDDFVALVLSCPNCGTSTELYLPSQNKMNDYKYWSKDGKGQE